MEEKLVLEGIIENILFIERHCINNFESKEAQQVLSDV